MTPDGATAPAVDAAGPAASLRGRLEKQSPSVPAIATVFWPLNRVFSLGASLSGRTWSRIVLFLGLPVIFVFLVSWAEGTLVLAGDAVGLMEHYGFLLLFLVHPLLVLGLPLVIRRFSEAFSHADEIVDEPAVRQWRAEGEVVREVSATIAGVLQSRLSKAGRVLACLLGIIAVSYNALNTTTPTAVYHHDVWDSGSHVAGYWAARAYLAFTWGLLLPCGLYGLLLLSLAGGNLYRRLSTIHQGMAVALSHLGRATGSPVDHFSRAMGAVMLTILPLSLSAAGLLFVHGMALPIVAGTMGWIAFACTVFFWPTWQTHRAIQRKQRLLLRPLEARAATIDHDVLCSLANGNLPDERLSQTLEAVVAVHKRLEQTPTWPSLAAGVFQLILLVSPFFTQGVKQIIVLVAGCL